MYDIKKIRGWIALLFLSRADLPPRCEIVPVLQATSLDIRTAQTHTDLMLSCRTGALYRTLTLLGLVLVFLGMAYGASAADDSPRIPIQYSLESSKVVFPYLSPSEDQRKVIFNAFTFQMRLFGAVSGNGTGIGVKALYYLALTGILIGALMIIFNAKYRRFAILGPWLLVAIITLFSPYGSKLLFYPLAKNVNATQIVTNNTETVADCPTNPVLCGFAPQLAAIHTASVLQLSLSDIFNSIGWKGVMESIQARELLNGNTNLVSSPESIAKAQRFRDQCGERVSDWNNLVAARIANGANASSGGGGYTGPNLKLVTTLGSEFNNILDDMTNLAGEGQVMYPPRAMVLYGDSEYPNVDGWNQPYAKDKYTQGLKILYEAVTGDSNQIISHNKEIPDSISFDEALKKMDEANFFKAGETGCWTSHSCGVFPGFFFYWSGAKENSSEGSNGESSAGEYSAAEYRKCYSILNGFVKNQVNTNECTEGTVSGSNMLRYENQSAYLKGLTNSERPSGYSYSQWDGVIQAMKDPLLRQTLNEMPVGIMDFKMSDVANAGTTAIKAPMPVQEKGSPLVDCLAWGNMLVDERLDYVLGNTGKMKDLDKLRELLKTQRAIPAAQEGQPTLNIDDIYEQGEICYNAYEAGVQCLPNAGSLKEASAILTAYGNAERDAEIAKNAQLTSSERYATLLRVVMTAVDESSALLQQNSRAEDKATKDSRTVDVVGNDFITNVGGLGSVFFGKMLTSIGAFFTGPLAVGIVYFMSLLVDMALLILIVLTPILFFIALAMPGAAVGVLTISIMGVFVLKAVPITLLLMNNLAGMIYTMIGAVGMEERATMQNLLVIAMAGLYANVIGMTFFLLFKMGDASAVLSRFTALDGSAKQVAEAGWNMTKAAAALAALPVAGAVGGAIGSRFAAAAANRAGASPELINLMRGGQKAAEDKTPEGKGGQLKDENGNKLVDTNGTEFNAQEEQKIAENTEGIGNAMLPLNEGGLGLSEQEASELYARGSMTTKDGFEFALGEDGKPVMKTMAASDLMLETRGDLMSADEVSLRDSAAVKQSFVSGAAKMHAANEDIIRQEAEKDAVAHDVKTRQPQNVEQANAVETAMLDKMTTPDATNKAAGGNTSGGGGGQGGTGGVAANVTVVGGKLDGVGTIDSLEAKAAESVSEAGGSPSASGGQQLEGTSSGPASAGDASKQGSGSSAGGGTGGSSPTTAQLIENEKNLRAQNLNQQYAQAVVDMEQKYAKQFESIAAKEKSGEKLTRFESYLQDTHKKMLEQDPAGLVLGEQTKALSNIERLQASLGARYGADNAPSALSSALSGFYGGIAGGGGGLAKIPVIGTAVGEALNEFHQAPERARAWKAVGGFGSWWSAQGDAKRMGFYQKEMAPLAAAHQYTQMSTVGGFQAQADIARQAASEAVAKSRTQWEGMMADRKGAYATDEVIATTRNEIKQQVLANVSDKSIEAKFSGEIAAVSADKRVEKINEIKERETRDIVEYQLQSRLLKDTFANGPLAMSATELAGLGRHEVAARIGSLRSEASVAQLASLKVETLKGGLDGNMMMRSTDLKDFKTEKTDVFLTPDMLANMHGNIGVKNAAKRADEMMVVNYGILEKQYLRGDKDWNASRNMAFNREAAANFARMDVDTDYLVGGHLNMVQGKERFFESRGQYQSLVKYRHETNAMLADYLKQELQSGRSAIQTAIKDAGAPLDVSAWTSNDRLKLEKWAKKELQGKGITVPLDAVFDVALTNGAAKYDQKVMTAMYEVASQNAENWVKTQKSAAAALSAKLPDVRNLTKKISFEKDGVKFDIGSATEKLFEKFDMALGSRATEAIQVFNDYFSKEGRQKNSFDIKINKSDKRNPEGWMRVKADDFENYLKELDKQSPGQGAKIREAIKEKKAFRQKDDFIEWGYLSQTDDY